MASNDGNHCNCIDFQNINCKQAFQTGLHFLITQFHLEGNFKSFDPESL